MGHLGNHGYVCDQSWAKGPRDLIMWNLSKFLSNCILVSTVTTATVSLKSYWGQEIWVHRVCTYLVRSTASAGQLPPTCTFWLCLALAVWPWTSPLPLPWLPASPVKWEKSGTCLMFNSHVRNKSFKNYKALRTVACTY